MTKTTTKQHLTPKQRQEIMALLGSTLLDKNNGFFKYTAGNNDETIAAQLGVGEAQVRAIRSQFFGKLEPSHDFIKYGELIGRVKTLEATVEGLSKAVLDLVQAASPPQALRIEPRAGSMVRTPNLSNGH